MSFKSVFYEEEPFDLRLPASPEERELFQYKLFTYIVTFCWIVFSVPFMHEYLYDWSKDQIRHLQLIKNPSLDNIMKVLS